MEREVIKLTDKVEANIHEMPKNKQVMGAYNRFRFYEGRTLWDCYNNPSRAKENAWEYCNNLCNAMGGNDLTVVGYNSTLFSAGFTCKHNNRDIFVYITRDQDRFIYLD